MEIRKKLCVKKAEKSLEISAFRVFLKKLLILREADVIISYNNRYILALWIYIL